MADANNLRWGGLSETEANQALDNSFLDGRLTPLEKPTDWRSDGELTAYAIQIKKRLTLVVTSGRQKIMECRKSVAELRSAIPLEVRRKIRFLDIKKIKETPGRDLGAGMIFPAFPEGTRSFTDTERGDFLAE